MMGLGLLAKKYVYKHSQKKRKLPKLLGKMMSIYSVEYFSYSQNCEDIMFRQLIQGKKEMGGYYVDVGAHHPIRFSNTYLLYTSGWSGINIDPLKGAKELFDEYRPNDVNLNFGISSTPGKMTYYSFDESAFNTTNSEHANEVTEKRWSRLKSKEEIDVVRLETIFDEYIGETGHIDLMTIDVETREMDVLLSNNWDKYIPDWIIIEALDVAYAPLREVYDDPVIVFLLEKGYEPISKNKNSVLLEHRRKGQG